MSDDLNDLYQEIILDHFKHPRHAAKLAREEVLVDEENPTCGDRIQLTAVVENGRVADIRHESSGCAISMASASMMAETLIGKPIEEARTCVKEFVKSMKSEQELSSDTFGDAVALAGVRRYPLRIKCATMSWHAADHALAKLVQT